jgi:hypothetical protein
VPVKGVIAYHRASGNAYHQSKYAADPAKARASATKCLRNKLKQLAVPLAVRQAQQAERARKAQERRAAQIARLVDRIGRHDLGAVGGVVVTRADSLQAGNCVSGTDSFINRYLPGRTQATIKQVADAIGDLDLASLGGADVTLARQLVAACLTAIRRHNRINRATNRTLVTV